MFRSIIVFIIVLLSSSSYGQIQKLSSSTHKLEADINLLDNQFSLVNNLRSEVSAFQDVGFTLEHGDINISFRLDKTQGEQYYQVRVFASLNTMPLNLYEEDLIGGVGKQMITNQNEKLSILWMRLFDRYVNLEGRLSIILEAELWGTPKLPYGIDCLEKPKFSSKQLIPHYIAAGVGVGVLGASLFFGNKSNDIYNNDYLTQRFEENAEPFYQDANDNRHKQLITRYAGAAILLADGAVLLYRYLRYRKKISAYNEFCAGTTSVSVRPMFELPTVNSSVEQIGLRLKYTF